ncbi:serine/arginine repetitive matrix protein 2 [Drosophila teissieri]|uniref:serine/arginine repetitive matrix protein 2 n=1 Tax=Drosophila teissieri TaxID=7243 RepID=UPI001CBA2423|nr:serine/arginine repetitive matrix protein 2 [Drosophila teissieri]
MRNLCWLLAVPMAILPLGCAIVGAGRDLLLTPRQGHQLSGKRIFYEEPAEERVLNQRRSASERPWERTLKHVTYVTLFTDAAVGAAAGNLSQLHEYHDFLQTPYVPADDQGGAALGGAPSARFGDIMTLAKGYLEQLPGPGNGSYRFLEGGTCFQLQCPSSSGSQRRALWQVQRIRHRDGDPGRHYHYELKFSVTPLEQQNWQPHHQHHPHPMSYIQKESDYPRSFGRLAHEQDFQAQRRQDRERYGAGGSAAGAGGGGNAEQSQATFVHGIFQPAPPPPKLNIGEYLKGAVAVAPGSPKIELFPGLLNLGLRPNYVVPTTFRPSYPAALKFGPHPELERFPSHSGELGHAGNGNGNVGAAPPGAVTHHFHHHFYVAPGAGDAQLHPELGYRLPSSSPAEPTTPPNLYPHQQTVQFPSSHSGSSESLEEQEQDLLLRTPQIYGQASKYQTAKLPPLLIYAGGSAGDEDKSFVQSEPLEETVYRYSEPDPLYVHQNPIDVLPDKQPQDEETEKAPPVQVQDGDQRRGEQRPVVSLEQPELTTTAAATTAAAPALSATTTETASTERSTTHVVPTTSASFVSTSTHFSPLRSISRYRTTPKMTAGRSTTTTTSTSTQAPLSKWAKRRREQDSKAKSSHRHEAFVSTTPSTSTTSSTTTTSSSTTSSSTTTSTTQTPPSTTAASTRVPLAPPLPPAPPKEVVEVLTQKSVSRSVSIKVGENGEEIPIIVDDEENEVKPVLNN